MFNIDGAFNYALDSKRLEDLCIPVGVCDPGHHELRIGHADGFGHGASHTARNGLGKFSRATAARSRPRGEGNCN